MNALGFPPEIAVLIYLYPYVAVEYEARNVFHSFWQVATDGCMSSNLSQKPGERAPYISLAIFHDLPLSTDYDYSWPLIMHATRTPFREDLESYTWLCNEFFGVVVDFRRFAQLITDAWTSSPLRDFQPFHPVYSFIAKGYIYTGCLSS